MGKIKFGVVGCGGQGGGWARYLNEIEEAELVALCDINKANLNKTKKETGCEFTTSDFDECLDQDIDAIVNATPHYLHAPFSIKALENEINVFVEKPMAITLHQCDRMIRAAKENDVKLQVGLQRRFGTSNLKIKRILDNKLIGDVYHINLSARWFRDEMYFLMSSPVRDEDGGKHWRGIWNTEGGSALINQTIHLIDLFQWFGGEIADIQASAHTCFHQFIETEDNVGAVVNFRNGAIGLIQAGVVYTNESDRIEIYGTKGKIKVDENGLNIQTGVAHDKKLLEIEPSPYKRPVMHDFINAIEEDEQPTVNGYEGRKAVEVVRGIYMSVMNNGKISFPVADNGCFPRLPNYYKPEF